MYNDENSRADWADVITEHISRSKAGIIQNGIFSPDYADKTLGLLTGYDAYFKCVKAFPFIDDAKAGNVPVHNGKFSGLVDFDSICFGDDLYAIALTRMSLLKMNADLKYIDYLNSFRGVSPEEELILDLYTLVFCVDFMGEAGMKFNREAAALVSETDKQQLTEIFISLYTRLNYS